MTADVRNNRFPWVLTLASALVFAALIALGLWQVQRLQWKLGLIAEAEAAASRPPTPLPARTVDLPEFQKVVLDCDFGDAAYRQVELQSIHDGRPGVRLITTCHGRLVDLGFMDEGVSARPPQASFRTPRLPGSYPTVIAEIRDTPRPNAMALPPENGRFFARDNRAIGAALGLSVPAPSQTLYAVTPAFPEFRALQPSAPPAAFSNNHLGYAITWFGLALALLGVYVALLRRKLKSAPREERPS